MVVVNHPSDVSSFWRYLTNLGVAVPEVEGHDFLVDLLLTKHRLRLPATLRQASMNKTRVVRVEPGNKMTWLFLLHSLFGLIIVLFWTHFSGETLKSANVWFHRAWNMVSCVLGSSQSNSIRQFLIEQCLKLSFGFTDLCRCKGAWLSRV